MPRPTALRKYWLTGSAVAALFLCLPASAQPQENLPRSLNGNVGLIDMPSARMAPDGHLGINFSFFQDVQRVALMFQATPWLETSFRYSALQNFQGYSVFYDRSFAFKLRLLQESAYLPAIAIGSDDLVGTGIFSGEYIVASKQLGDFDFTLGMGFGRLATANTIRNPLTLISNSFETRESDATGVGQFSISQYFHGPKAGIFGGATWQTPIDRLTLSAEYSSDAYTTEQLGGMHSKPRSQLNLGASYRVSDSVGLGLSWIYGRSIAVNLSFSADPTRGDSVRLEEPLTPVAIRTDEQLRATHGRHPYPVTRDESAQLVAELWTGAVTDISLTGTQLRLTIANGQGAAACANAAGIIPRYSIEIDEILVAAQGPVVARCATSYRPRTLLSASMNMQGESAATPLVVVDASGPASSNATTKIEQEAQRQGIFIEALALEEADALVYYNSSRYSSEAEVINRLTRILLAHAPAHIEAFHFIRVDSGKPQSKFTILRGPTERSLDQQGSFDLLMDGNAQSLPPMENPVLDAARSRHYPRFSWNFFPQFRQQLFDPQNPFAVQLLAGLEGTLEVLPGLTFYGEVEASLYDNFNTYRMSDSVLPHVRTDYVKYFSDGKNGIGALEGQYRFRLAPNVYGVARAGYLESMFAGVGGELLWRPWNQRWALGLELYAVRQREFDRLLGLQDYRTITGHVSLYYSSPWYGLNFSARVGRYLAKDTGATLEITRRFSTGIEIGAFVTKTNVSAAQFGEGSFDKGIIIRIPLDWMLPIQTRATYSLDLRPLQRDGGAFLQNAHILYEETRPSSQDEVLRRTHSFEQ